jgi:hypothetical protein
MSDLWEVVPGAKKRARGRQKDGTAEGWTRNSELERGAQGSVLGGRGVSGVAFG